MAHFFVETRSSLQDLEDQAVPFLPVLAGEGFEVLHGRGLQWEEAVLPEHTTDGVEDVLAAQHLHRGEIAGAFGDAGLHGKWKGRSAKYEVGSG